MGFAPILLLIVAFLYMLCYQFLFRDGLEYLQILSKFDINSDYDIFDVCPFMPMDPWHKDIMDLVDVKYGFDKACEKGKAFNPVTSLVDGKVILNKGKSSYNCRGRCLFYVNDWKYKASNWADIRNATFECDFVETECQAKDNNTSRFIHMQISERLAANFSQDSQRFIPDVHLIVLDSVASSQFIRSLPRTVNFVTRALSAVEFRKLNKVGENSRPNGFVALLGKTTEDVEREIMNVETIKADLSYSEFCSSYLDNETFIPAEYQKAGYKTFDAEDYRRSLLYFPNCKGLKNNSLDHNYRVFYRRLYSDRNLSEIHYKRQCQQTLDHILNYLSLFLHSYKVRYLFAADHALYSFFLEKEEQLANAFVFFFGDHGPRLGKEARRKHGMSESKNPFLYVILPKRLRGTALHKQLKVNSEELVTFHDLHATFIDILRYQPASNFTDSDYKKPSDFRRGSSLLRRFEAGKPRNCKTLPIPFQYCICQYGRVNVTDKRLLRKLGWYAVDELNSFLEFNNVSSQCEEVKLKKVEAEQYTTAHRDVKYWRVKIFDVIFEVEAPAKGTFQIPLRMEGEELLLSGRFIRLDKYGSSGDCMSNYLFRPLCTCKKSNASSTKPPKN